MKIKGLFRGFNYIIKEDKIKKLFLKKIVFVDILLVIVFNAVVFYIFSAFDVSESLYTYIEQYENFELDEIILLFVSISISLLLFSVRRILELNKLLKKTKNLSIIDHLTKLYNRRYVQEMYLIEIERSKRKRKALSILLLDIDNFKKINDQYGHNTGDKVLQEISKIIVSVARKSDVAVRWGGEEFLLMCPEINLEEAKNIAKRLIETTNNKIFEKVGNVTFSIGLVDTYGDESLESLVHRADTCLYEAKKNGKNRYISSP